MPPKVKITKEAIVAAAVALVRQKGHPALNARDLAGALGCSTQPIFSNFSGMDAVRLAVVQAADRLCQEYIDAEIRKQEYPAYKASGMAYIRFAKEEKELFKLLYMRDRSGETAPQGLELNDQMETIIHDQTGLRGADMKLFHLEMWAYVHGIAAMFTTGFLNLDWELVSKMLTDSYQGLRKQYNME